MKNTQIFKCKEWCATISRYEAKQYTDFCNTCLYGQDTLCPAGLLQKERKRY